MRPGDGSAVECFSQKLEVLVTTPPEPTRARRRRPRTRHHPSRSTRPLSPAPLLTKAAHHHYQLSQIN